MTRWEYKAFQAPREFAIEELDKLGAEGWEAFFVDPRTGIFWLKRPLPEVEPPAQPKQKEKRK